MLPPDGAATPASRILRISSSGTGSGFSRRIDRVVVMISKRSRVSSGMPSSWGSVIFHTAGMRRRAAANFAHRQRPSSALFLEAFGTHAAVEHLIGDAGRTLLHRLVLDG